MDKSGLLPHAAPGLYASLLRVLPPEELSDVLKTFEEVAVRGGTGEFPIIREVDASFNPRPARIASIMLRESKPCNITYAVTLAFWSCLLSEGDFLQSSFLVPPGVYESLSRISSGNLIGSGSHDELLVAIALQLDRVRHLHMTELGAAEKANILQEAERFSVTIGQANPTLSMLKKLQHAIMQQKRVLGEC